MPDLAAIDSELFDCGAGLTGARVQQRGHHHGQRRRRSVADGAGQGSVQRGVLQRPQGSRQRGLG